MSRIGRKPITIPEKVKVTASGDTVTVAGPGGTLKVKHRHEVKVAVHEADKAVQCSVDETKYADDRQVMAFWGTTRALINSAIVGVTKGYEETMEVVGVGWTASVAGKKLKLVIGYADPVMMDIPDGLKVVVDKQLVRLSGADKKMIGQFASDMRKHRRPEPYNGKGVKYQSETIKRKSGKAFGTA